MKKQKDDMQVNVAGIRRNIKNLAHNYSDAQVKVREATSNDPWGPSATIMAEIADLTYNVVAFSEIMQMIWKRLNDHGKNWRHVYKALILLEYLIKTGTEKVAQQCKENIFAIQTLREFVYFEENKDQGTHVREKARQLVTLLKDDERLKNERAKALKAKERFAQHASGFGSDGYVEGPTHRETPTSWTETETKPTSDIEFVRPQTAGEEELQLQLAMAMSREEAEQEEAKRRSDDVRLQLALSQSEQDFKQNNKRVEQNHLKQDQVKQSHLMDLLDISLGAASISSNSPNIGASGASDPWIPPARAVSQLSDPWSGTSSPQVDPWPSNSLAGSKPTNSLTSDNWLTSNPTHRTQSPSVTSGSSTEGWLQNNSVSGVGATNGHSSLNPDPWLYKTSPKMCNISTTDPWLLKTNSIEKPEDPWQLKTDPWSPPINEKRPSPVGAMTSPMSDLDDFDVITNRNKTGQENNFNKTNNNNTSSLLDEIDPLAEKKFLKTPQSFLGENSSLVNLDNLIKPVVPNSVVGTAPAYNPFNDSTTSIISQQGITIAAKNNLFQQQIPSVPSINQLKQQQSFPVSLNQDPWAPISSSSSVAQYEYLIDYDSDQITVCKTPNNNYTNMNYEIQNVIKNKKNCDNEKLIDYPCSIKEASAGTVIQNFSFTNSATATQYDTNIDLKFFNDHVGKNQIYSSPAALNINNDIKTRCCKKIKGNAGSYTNNILDNENVINYGLLANSNFKTNASCALLNNSKFNNNNYFTTSDYLHYHDFNKNSPEEVYKSINPKENNNMPWLKSETATSNPFLS